MWHLIFCFLQTTQAVILRLMSGNFLSPKCSRSVFDVWLSIMIVAQYAHEPVASLPQAASFNDAKGSSGGGKKNTNFEMLIAYEVHVMRFLPSLQ
jgi:hypothetical protein